MQNVNDAVGKTFNNVFYVIVTQPQRISRLGSVTIILFEELAIAHSKDEGLVDVLGPKGGKMWHGYFGTYKHMENKSVPKEIYRHVHEDLDKLPINEEQLFLHPIKLKDVEAYDEWGPNLDDEFEDRKAYVAENLEELQQYIPGFLINLGLPREDALLIAESAYEKFTRVTKTPPAA